MHMKLLTVLTKNFHNQRKWGNWQKNCNNKQTTTKKTAPTVIVSGHTQYPATNGRPEPENDFMQVGE